MKNKILFQIGDAKTGFYKFQKTELEHTISTGFAQNLEESDFVDGEIRKNGFNKNFKQDYILQLSFIHYLQSGITENQLKSFFNSSIHKLFFYEEVNDKIIIYYTYAEAVRPLDDIYESESDDGLEYKRYSTDMRFIHPFYYQCLDDTLKYVDLDSIISNHKLDEGKVLDSGLELDWREINSIQSIAGLDKETINNIIGRCNSTDRIGVTEQDQFIKVDSAFVPISNTISQTLTTNNSVNTSYSLVQTNASNNIQAIRISNLDKGDIINIENDYSDLSLEWLWHESSGEVVFNTYNLNLYNSSGNVLSASKYRFNYKNQMLSFNTNSIVNALDSEQEVLRLQKTSSNNITIDINVLPIFD